MSTIESLTQNLNITERLTASWRLFKVSAGVVRREPALIGVTLLGLLVGLLLSLLVILGVGTLLAPAAISDLLAGRIVGSAIAALFFALTIGHALYSLLFSGIVNAFFGGATAEIAMRRIEGSDPSLGDGLGAARRRFRALAVFGVITGIVRALTSVSVSSGSGTRHSAVDSVASAARQAAAELYRLLTCLSLPALMREPIGGTAAIGRSTEIMRRVWPQAVATGYGIRAVTGAVSGIFGLILFAVIGQMMFNVVGAGGSGAISLNELAPVGSDPFNATFGGGGSLPDTAGLFGSLFDSLFGSLQIPGYVLPLAIVCLLAMRVIGTIGALLEAVFNGALYLYATTGTAGDFAAADLAKAAVTSDGVVHPGAASV